MCAKYAAKLLLFFELCKYFDFFLHFFTFILKNSAFYGTFFLFFLHFSSIIYVVYNTNIITC